MLKGQILAFSGFLDLGSRHSTTELRPQFQRINIIPFAMGLARGKLIADCR